MDGVDDSILQTWTHQTVDGTTIRVEEARDRKKIGLRVASALPGGGAIQAWCDLGALDACIRMLTQARDRLEALGAMRGLEKLAP